jgi:exodeoxyribonuclease VII large subunit
VHRRLERERELMAGLPERMRHTVRARVGRERAETEQGRERIRRRLRGLLEAGGADLVHVRARVRALSPQATLDRGYAVVQLPDGTVLREASAASGTLRIRVARGEFEAVASAQ